MQSTDSESPVSPADMMTIVAARMLDSNDVCFVGIGIPSQAANLARRLHAPDIVLIYESGTIGASPTVLPLSIGDGELASSAESIVPMSELFGQWLQAGRIDVGFLGAAQIDKHGNLNSTVIGAYAHPAVRLPGAGGAPDIAAFARKTLIMIRHQSSKLVEQLEFTTSIGYLSGHNAREEAGLAGGPEAVITDLCVLRPDQQTRELVVDEVFPGVERERIRKATGWKIRFAENCTMSEPPSKRELSGWTELQRETQLARESLALTALHQANSADRTNETRSGT